MSRFGSVIISLSLCLITASFTQVNGDFQQAFADRSFAYKMGYNLVDYLTWPYGVISNAFCTFWYYLLWPIIYIFSIFRFIADILWAVFMFIPRCIWSILAWAIEIVLWLLYPIIGIVTGGVDAIIVIMSLLVFLSTIIAIVSVPGGGILFVSLLGIAILGGLLCGLTSFFTSNTESDAETLYTIIFACAVIAMGIKIFGERSTVGAIIGVIVGRGILLALVTPVVFFFAGAFDASGNAVSPYCVALQTVQLIGQFDK